MKAIRRVKNRAIYLFIHNHYIDKGNGIPMHKRWLVSGIMKRLEEKRRAARKVEP